ncbi:DUF6705 family protein [Chryseobacterium sp. SL1]|uniref:DUF6705 family protein n=1 Tax=Chryseobacterium sp. SL1 TaxID=2995159 RepID=UPI0022755FC0|nr:DUF6705 family protein [Chryseobacterium sp. SL1]MCY1661418.1 hypothetical protein [Chryseobacterium sp. SL1]
MKILSLFALYITLLSCKAQQVLPLNSSELDTSVNSYFKDLNNELEPYIGNWKAVYQGKTVLLKITKESKRSFTIEDKTFYRDAIIVKYEVKDSTGQILQSTLNSDFATSNLKNIILSLGTNLNSNNEVNLLYGGGNCNVGMGDIVFKKIDSNHFYWNYYPGTTTRNDITCPPNLDYNIYLPETENLIFTKQ